jgi:hypothetical protein
LDHEFVSIFQTCLVYGFVEAEVMGRVMDVLIRELSGLGAIKKEPRHEPCDQEKLTTAAFRTITYQTHLFNTGENPVKEAPLGL